MVILGKNVNGKTDSQKKAYNSQAGVSNNGSNVSLKNKIQFNFIEIRHYSNGKPYVILKSYPKMIITMINF